MKTFTSHSIEETEKIAADWLTDLSKRCIDSNSNEALVVGLSGHLGAGKTAFVKAIAKALGIEEDVTSPTFVIMKLYGIGSNGGNDPIRSKQVEPVWKRLVHIDAYRLERPEELEALGFEALVADKGNLIMIEWPENVELNDFVEEASFDFQIEGGGHRISLR
jgi:tRNA threonylcarbamoyladenosine biosynthesis protein TsaE